MGTKGLLAVFDSNAVIKLMLLVYLFLAGCAPMPGNNLFPGLEHSTPLEKVDIEIVIDPIRTSVECNRQLWHSDNWHQAMLNCLFNACFVLACAQVHWNDEGEISQCNVFLSFDSSYMLEHELKHCEGYDDDVY